MFSVKKPFLGDAEGNECDSTFYPLKLHFCPAKMALSANAELHISRFASLIHTSQALTDRFRGSVPLPVELELLVSLQSSAVLLRVENIVLLGYGRV